MFAMPFKSSYLRILLRRATWRDTWTNLQRLHKDRRARKRFAALSLLILVPIICAIYLLWVLRIGVYAVPLVLAAAVTGWRGYWRYKEKAKARLVEDPGPQWGLLRQA